MYKLPVLGSPLAAPTPSMKELVALEDTEEGKPPYMYDPSVIGQNFPAVPDYGATPVESTGNQYDSGRKDGASVGDLFRASGTPYTMKNIFDLTNYQINAKSPTNPGGYDSVLHSKHYVSPMTENTRNKFFSKPFEEMNPREQTNFFAYHPDINKATDGMSPQEARAYRKARYGYDNSAYFKTGPEDKRSFEDMVANYKPLDQRVAERKGV